MAQLFAEVTPAGPTPLGECLESTAQPLLKDLDGGKSRKKTNFLVITDGRASELYISAGIKRSSHRRTADDAESAIVQIANRLDRAGATLSQVRPLCPSSGGASDPHPQLGIQFVQIGTNSDARAFLEKLDNDLKDKHNIRVRSLQPAVFAFRSD